jgi:hypothetical protein
MTKSSWTSRSLFAALLAVLMLPSYALAGAKIVDVMYDPPGADQGREWIKVANTGAVPVNLAGYRLYEGGTNHKLTVAAGTSTLDAGAVAIITTDPGQYEADYPAFAGAVFKSSFSLSNVGETIELKDPSLAVVDTYSYTAPPVAKEPLPAKAVKPAKSVSTSAQVKTKNGSSTYAAANSQAAALPLAAPLSAVPMPWVYALGTLTFLVLGTGASLYVWPERRATSGPAGEFELEG